MEIAVLQMNEGSDHVSVNHPRGGLAEALIQRGEERLAGRRIDKAEESLVDDDGPFGGTMEWCRAGTESLAKALCEEGGRDVRIAMLAREIGIDMTDRRTRVDERGTDVKSDGADFGQGRGRVWEVGFRGRAGSEKDEGFMVRDRRWGA